MSLVHVVQQRNKSLGVILEINTRLAPTLLGITMELVVIGGEVLMDRAWVANVASKANPSLPHQ